jgi:hypothetical protein
MSVVMPPLLQSAQLKPDVSITSAGDDGESDDEGYVLGFPSMSKLLFFYILFFLGGAGWFASFAFQHDLFEVLRVNVQRDLLKQGNALNWVRFLGSAICGCKDVKHINL